TLLLSLYQGKFRVAVQHVDLAFLLPLGVGIITAVLFFTHVIPLPALLRTHPALVYGLFFGLLIASIGLLLRNLGHIGLRDGGWILFGAMAGFWLANTIPMNTPDAAWFIFLSGALAICAMILPGISGAFVLLILNKYAYLLDAIGKLDFSVIVPFMLGAIVGLLLFSRFLVWLLRRFYRQTFLVLTGMLAGSLWVIWPFQEYTYQNIGDKSHLIGSMPSWPREFDGTVMAVFGLIVIGAATVIALDVFAKRPRSF
ncbi:MAG: DUF368 domain-containing protein, partial [Gammaproteobacteria bacterium]|nr:DUF368 domain-containing protein [Gammaproteobacteria bacterium]